jgi:hypothetical protein
MREIGKGGALALNFVEKKLRRKETQRNAYKERCRNGKKREKVVPSVLPWLSCHCK